ncbi:MAG: creatininase family protein, partial [Treponema sp.]|nr:creatininase family protein [Treponema sp.]
PQLNDEQKKNIFDLTKTNDLGYHAGLSETAAIMHLRPDLVDMKAQDVSESASLGRLAELREKGVFSGFNWYSEFPYHFAGDPSPATPELGKTIIDMYCENLADVIRAVKNDNESEKFIKEFSLMSQNPQ